MISLILSFFELSPCYPDNFLILCQIFMIKYKTCTTETIISPCNKQLYTIYMQRTPQPLQFDCHNYGNLSLNWSLRLIF